MNGLRLTLILWLFFSLASWPSSLAAPSHIDYGNGSSGGNHEFRDSYLAIPRGPIWLSDVARIDSVARQHQAMAVVVEPETEERPQPSTRGALRVWVTHYAAEDLCTAEQIRRDQCITASGHPLRIGHAAGYPVRNEEGRIVSSNIRVDGLPVLPFGTNMAVAELGEVTLMDTGMGMSDGRPWLDVAVASHDEAVRLGAGWREVRVLND